MAPVHPTFPPVSPVCLSPRRCAGQVSGALRRDLGRSGLQELLGGPPGTWLPLPLPAHVMDLLLTFTRTHVTCLLSDARDASGGPGGPDHIARPATRAQNPAQRGGPNNGQEPRLARANGKAAQVLPAAEYEKGCRTLLEACDSA